MSITDITTKNDQLNGKIMRFVNERKTIFCLLNRDPLCNWQTYIKRRKTVLRKKLFLMGNKNMKLSVFAQKSRKLFDPLDRKSRNQIRLVPLM